MALIAATRAEEGLVCQVGISIPQSCYHKCQYITCISIGIGNISIGCIGIGIGLGITIHISIGTILDSFLQSFYWLKLT